jgi:hypothetical protein
MTSQPAATAPDPATGPATAARAGSAARTALVYTALRIAVFALVFAVTWLFGLDVFPALLIAVVVSGALSYLLLRRQREALTATVAQRVESGRHRRASHDQSPTPEEVARVTGRPVAGEPPAPNPPTS